ncbi:MAG TPA: HAMP domain-containing methyl-accepting chemotaxis protein [Skermanella sp.]|nr:HAMP domain-containing methyl-accepting chemotaxis protein [Skermanella sp.]
MSSSASRSRVGTAFDNTKVRTKISLASGMVLVVLVGLSAQSCVSFNRVNHEFDTYVHSVSVVDAARDIDRDMIDLRRHVREYAFTGHAESADKARAVIAQLRKDFENAGVVVQQDDQKARLQASRERFDIYAKDFDNIVAWKTEGEKLISSVLDPDGAGAAKDLEELRLLAVRDGNGNAATLAGAALETLLQGRLAANKMLARHDKASADAAEEKFTALGRVLQTLIAASAGKPYERAAIETKELAEAYRKAFERVADLSEKIDHEITGPMFQAGNELSANAALIRNGAAEEEHRIETETHEFIDFTETLILGLSVAGFLLGAVLAWVIGRAISRPIVQMTDAMRRLAGGDRTVEIPGVGRLDEIGAMAGAVDVFKQNAITADRLAAEQQAEQAKKEARAAEVMKLVGNFDSTVSMILRTVSSAATQLDSTAQSMAAIAEETDRQATASAAAAEQTSANVQTVASAAEEMTGSLQEIARQVTRSTGIANQAVDQAEQTNATVLGLAEAAQKINEVVDLIADIAGQTNLLALNATIEAARAGEAGKGFAVVASEVKSLATRTSRATGEISAQIAAMQGATTGAVTAIQEIGVTIQEINDSSTTIAAAVEEQTAATAEISRSVTQAAAGTREVSANVSQVTQASQQTGAAASQVLSAASELAQQAEMLRTEVERFLSGIQAA